MARQVGADVLVRVEEIVAALKDGIEAAGVGVFDDDCGVMFATSEASTKAFWNVLRGMACSRNWGAWYRDLRTAKHMVAGCACGGEHALHAFVLLERWVVLVLFDGPPQPYADAVMASAMRLLGELLPSERIAGKPPRRGPRGGGGGESARLGIPLWWVRKS
jgi:hypothetical protein